MTVLAVVGGKGSPGSTFVAINLAAAIASKKRGVVLVDLDVHGGDLAAYLGLDPRSGLFPLMKLEGRHPAVSAILHEAQAKGNLRCIAGFPSAESAEIEMAESVLAALRECDQLVVADIGRITPRNAPIVSKADGVLVTVRPDMVGVYAARRCVDTLRKSSSVGPGAAAVINGWEWKRSADLAETVDALPISVAGTIPLDRPEAYRALANQRPIRKRKAVKAFWPLAEELIGALKDVARDRVPA